MISYCKNCKKDVEVKIEVKEEIFTFRLEQIIYDKEIPFCSVCGSLLDIEEINEKNAKTILEESEVFNVLCPFD